MSGWRSNSERCLARMIVAIVLLALSLGCAQTQTVVRWQKPGATQEELDQARSACEAQPGAEQVQIGRDRMEAEVRANAFVRCMESRGWTWSTELVEDGD